MKILITGFTGVQAHAGNSQLQMLSNIASIVAALENADHEVEWRPVAPGEDLDEYDRIIVSINGTGSWVSPFALGALYCIGKRSDTILTIDDWQANKAFCSTPEKELAVLWNPKLGRKWHAEAFEDPHIKKYIDSAVDELCYKHDRKMLVPSFLGGDLELLGLGARNAVQYDPSPFMDIYEYAPNIDKIKMWTSAGLAAKDSWFNKQTFTWPIEFFGIRKKNQMRLKEAALAGVYSERWGVISPPHPHVGSGWFRVRFLMCAYAKSVMYCDPREGAVFGKSYTTHSISDIEGMSNMQLASLAEWQSNEFFNNTWSKDTLTTFIEDFIK